MARFISRDFIATLNAEATAWAPRANCAGVDPELFFPERGASVREAKAVCRACEVRVECLDYAIEHGIKFGIWGAKSVREREAIKRRRRRSAQEGTAA